jgi:hypothetical protein
MLSTPRLAGTALALGLAAAALTTAPASAHPGTHHPHPSLPSQHVLASGLLSPLRAAVSANGTAYVSENFAGKIDRINRHGRTTTVYTDPNGYEVGGLSLAGRNVVFTVTQSEGEGVNLDSWLKVLTPSGHVRTIADLRTYENHVNPDQGTTYGFRDIDPTCAAKWPAANGPATYTGAVDSHPYATYVRRDGWIYVADAGANDVLLVSPSGRTIRTVATLPGIPLSITSDVATGMGLDPCFVGSTYYFEAVPTDIEVGPNGTVYVTSLPGGPEGPQLGARGSVFAIGGHTTHRVGHHAFRPVVRHLAKHLGWLHHGQRGGDAANSRTARPIVTGLLDPTGLAVAPNGTLYVAQLFGNEISKVTPGRHGAVVTDAISTPTPGEVEWTPQGLYFTSNVLSGTPEDPTGNMVPSGQLIRFGR